MDQTTKKQSKILKWSLIIGIVIVLNLFYNYSLSLIFTFPEYQNFCPDKQVISPPTAEKECVAVGGQWIENTYPPEKGVTVTRPETTPSPQKVGYCNSTFTCQKNFESALKAYEKNIFLSLVVLGILTIVVGIFLKLNETIGIALSLGGTLSLVIASIRYWSNANNILKVVILGLALAVLIYVGTKKFRE